VGKISYLIIGAAVGAAVAAAINYLFGPAIGATYDASYRSRLDFALEEGKHAALESESELRRQIDVGRGLSGPTQQSPDAAPRSLLRGSSSSS